MAMHGMIWDFSKSAKSLYFEIWIKIWKVWRSLVQKNILYFFEKFGSDLDYYDRGEYFKLRISPLRIIWAVNNGHPFKDSDTERLKPPVFDIDREYNHYDSGSLILTLFSNINNCTKL